MTRSAEINPNFDPGAPEPAQGISFHKPGEFGLELDIELARARELGALQDGHDEIGGIIREGEAQVASWTRFLAECREGR